MRAFSGFVSLMLFMVPGSTTAWAQAPSLESVRAASDAFMRAYGEGNPNTSSFTGPNANLANPSVPGSNDLSALIDQFDERANFSGTLEPFWLRGKAQISDLWARYFARYPDRRLTFTETDIQIYGNVSIETGYAKMKMGTDPTNSITTYMRYSITRVWQNNIGRIVNMMVDRMPSEPLPPGALPPWANTPRPPAPPAR